MPTRAWLLVGPLGWTKAVTGGSPGRFMDSRPWVRSVRGRMPPSGEWSGRAGWCALRDCFIGASAPSGRPSAVAACGGKLSLTWLPRSVVASPQ